MSKCLWRGGSVREELELSSPFPCYPVIQECQMKENLDRKKILCLIDLCVLDDFCIFLWLHICYRTYLFVLLTLRYIMFFNYFSILDDFTIFFLLYICHRNDCYVLFTLRNTIFLIIDFLDTSILVYFDIFSYNYTYSFKIDWLVLFVIRDEVLFLDFGHYDSRDLLQNLYQRRKFENSLVQINTREKKLEAQLWKSD